MRNDGFYRAMEKYDIDRSLEKHSDRVDRESSEIIIRYLKDKIRVDHVSQARYRKIGFSLILIRINMEKPFSEAGIDDYLDCIQALKEGRFEGKDGRSKPYSKNTVYDASVILKGFIRWLMRKNLTKITRDEADQIKPPARKDLTKTIKPDTLLTEDDVVKMAEAAGSQRNRSLILALYESGARIGEMGRLTWADLKFESLENPEKTRVINTAKLYIEDTKTNTNRYCRLVLSAPDLILHKNQTRPGEGDFVFSEAHKAPMTYTAMSRVLQRAAKKAGIQKPVRPHLFRHARATAMIREGIQESVIKKTLWNNLDSRMFKVYLSLGEDAIDDEMLKNLGVRELRKKHEDRLEHAQKRCGRCATINPPGASYCTACGRPLTPEEIKQADDLDTQIDSLLENPAKLRELAKILEAVAAKTGDHDDKTK